MLKVFHMIALCLALFALAACQPQALTQPLPVSTIPDGAQVLADGQAVCITPCKVDLTRNADHILTLKRDGFRQQDVIVQRRENTQDLMMKSVTRGVSDGRFFNNEVMGMNSGLSTYDNMKQTGEAYTLAPTAVSVTLAPLNAAAAKEAGLTPSAGLSALSPEDFGQISRALEGLPSGRTASWANPRTGLSFTLVPKPAFQDGGTWVRPFDLTLSGQGESAGLSASAVRTGDGQWSVSGAGGPGAGQGTMQTGQAPASDPAAALKGAALGGAAALPDVTARQTLSSSSSSSTTTQSSGPGTFSSTTTTTKTSVGASVGVNPGQALQTLDQLFSPSQDQPK